MPNRDAVRLAQETMYGHRTAGSRPRTPEWMRPEAGSAKDCCQIGFPGHSLLDGSPHCLRHGKTLGSTLCAHISPVIASDVRNFLRLCFSWLFWLKLHGLFLLNSATCQGLKARRLF